MLKVHMMSNTILYSLLKSCVQLIPKVRTKIVQNLPENKSIQFKLNRTSQSLMINSIARIKVYKVKIVRTNFIC